MHIKYILSFLMALTLHSNADVFFATEWGEPPDHLTPLDYPPDEYDRLIEKQLFLTHGQLGRFIIRPSFAAESCVSVYSDVSKEAEKKHGGWESVPDNEQTYFITVTKASESLWYAMQKKMTKKVKVTKVDREISLDLAAAIQRAWGRMLQHTKYPARASMGADGVTFQFSVWVRGLGHLHGQIWSPKGELTAEMASIGSSVAEFASNKDATEKPLIERLKALEAKIPKAK